MQNNLRRKAISIPLGTEIRKTAVLQLQIIKQNSAIPPNSGIISELLSIQTPKLTQTKEQENTSAKINC
jgi:hypothetical protein